jgi:hypothetical protein
MLYEIAKNRPRAYPHCKDMYGRESNMWIFGFKDFIRKTKLRLWFFRWLARIKYT